MFCCVDKLYIEEEKIDLLTFFSNCALLNLDLSFSLYQFNRISLYNSSVTL